MRRALVLTVACIAVVACKDEKPAPSPLAPDAAPPTVAETEPNDTGAAPQIVSPSAAVRASLAAGESDWFKVATGGEELVRAELGPVEGVAFVLEAYDGERNLRAKATGAAGQGVAIPNLLCKGSCLFRVSGAKKEMTGNYGLTLETSRPGPRSEREPNDRAVDAQPLTPGSPIDGLIGAGDDVDHFLVDAAAIPAEQVLAVTLLPPAEVRIELAVVRPSDGSELGAWRGTEPGAELRVRDIARPAEGETGLLLVVRSAWIPAEKGKSRRGSNPRAAYTLETKVMPGAPDLEVEPNEDAAHATTIDLAQPKRTGYLSPKGDADWWTFTLDAPSIVRADVSGVERVDLRLALIDPEKRDAEKDNELALTNEGALGEGEVLAGVALPAGQQFLRIDGALKKLDDRWVRDYENAERPYKLSLDISADDGTHEREPNNVADKASTAELGKTYRGYIHPAKDVDVWKLVVTEPASVTLTLSKVPKLDLSLTVREAAAPGSEATIVGTVDRTKVEGEERLVVPFEPGTYFIEVRAKGTESNALAPYSLGVR